MRFVVFLMAGCVLLAQEKKILVFDASPADVKRLEQAAPGKVRVVSVTPATVAGEIADADALIGPVTAEQMRAAKKLRWVQTPSAGVERYMFPEMTDSGVVLTNARIVMGPNIADHAFAMLLALTRNLPRAMEAKAAERWDRGGYGALELDGKTAVIVGAGGIGMQIAQRARGFGMKTIGVDPKDIPYTPVLDRVVRPDRMDTVMPLADVVFVAAPLTKESRGMIGPRQFEQMRKGAYFIAVSRGPLYQTDALVKALDSGHLGGAGLDVTDPEPLPAGHALWKFRNVIITPHVAGQSDKMPERRMQLWEENVRRFIGGEEMLNVVDKKKGY